MNKIHDPLRRRDVAATPEEQVRQWFIVQLRDLMKVPMHMMMSEVGFRFGGKPYRADIVVYGRDGQPLAVVECKRPDVDLDASVVEQAMRYNMVLGVSWLILTNGVRTLMFNRSGAAFVPCAQVPDYETMTCIAG